MDKKIRIVISGYYGFDNTGDEAILFAIINMLRANIKNIEIVVLSNNPQATTIAYNVQAVNRFSLHSIISAIKNCDLLISGGGSLLQDITSPKTIPYYLLIVQIALLFKRKVVFYSQGIGPVNHQTNRYLIKKVANKVNQIFVRDQKSRQLLINMGVHTAIDISPDPVFALKLDTSLNKKIKKELQYKKTVGIYIRPWKNQAQIVDAIIQTVNYLIKQEYHVYFICMQPSQDTQIAKYVAKHVGHTHIKVIEHPLTINETLSYTANFDFIIGMRLHSLIMAIVVQTPVIALSYDPKVENIMNEMHIAHQIQIEEISFAKLKEQIDYIRQNINLEREKQIDIEDIQKPIHYIKNLLLNS
ncbi:polysaccharide pyruvyl transferase CsaB [Candidatus Epulonipiscium viviparus]|uniref:polysaccharide pyruvyl transferase CsaB n=1 Tax=Candidatus Epulonipiscium viviparus TaxID=420336 RepID=UPI00016C0044|nr:polysaccharide pyruvyl transferase CsaB [Candidatus Epulopiscium viviparus]